MMRCFTLSARDPGHEIRKPDPAEHEKKGLFMFDEFLRSNRFPKEVRNVL